MCCSSKRRDERGRPRAAHLRLAGELSLDRQAIRRKPKTPDNAAPVRPKPAAKPARRAASKSGGIHSPGSKIVLFALLCVLPCSLPCSCSARGSGGWRRCTSPASLLSSCSTGWTNATPRAVLSARREHPASGRTAWWLARRANRSTKSSVTRRARPPIRRFFWLIVGLHQLLWIDLLLFDGTYVLHHLPSLVR